MSSSVELAGVRPTTGSALRNAVRSPYIGMPAWISLGLILYALGWSHLLGELHWETCVFLALAGLSFFALAFIVDTRPRAIRAPRPNAAAYLLVSVYFAVAYAMNHGIPIIQILRGESYDIYGFGVPGLHIIMLSLTGYLAVRSFAAFLDTRDTSALFLLFWMIVLLGSIANRSALSFVVFACLFVMFRSRRARPRTIVILLAVLIGLGYIFGQFGDIRLSFQIAQATQQAGSMDAIALISQPTDAFRSTGLSTTWLWVYMYLASPIANLNSAFAMNPQLCGVSCDLSGLFVHQMIPDVVGSRVSDLFGVKPFDKSAFLVSPSLTASTMFGSAVGYAGMVGALSLLLVLIAVAGVFVAWLRGSAVWEEGLALLATLIFFSFFENMLAYSALSLQLIFALIRAKTNIRML